MKRILLVEDDLTMRSLLKVLLEMENYSVTECDKRNEGEILEVILHEKPEIILLDVHIHTISGIDILKKVRLNPALKNVKILMSSGMAIEEQCLQAGANGFLLKPYMPDDLIQKLNQL